MPVNMPVPACWPPLDGLPGELLRKEQPVITERKRRIPRRVNSSIFQANVNLNNSLLAMFNLHVI
jgi:hypothetical protein